MLIHKKRQEENGFTLIELMIVVAIIGVLAAIAIPNFRDCQLRAKRNEILLNLKAIYTAEKTYQVENDRFLALAPSPRAVAALSSSRVRWQDQGGFANIGWLPSAKVYGVYQADVTAGGTRITGYARSDIDNDGNDAQALFHTDLAAPLTNQGVHMVTGNNVF